MISPHRDGSISDPGDQDFAAFLNELPPQSIKSFDIPIITEANREFAIQSRGFLSMSCAVYVLNFIYR